MPGNKKVSAGKQGDKIRSDCFVKIEMTKSGGIKSTLESKVQSLYGQSINDLIIEMCDSYEIINAHIFVDDYGALPFTIAARFEAAFKILDKTNTHEFLLKMNKKNLYTTSSDRMRRSRLYLPGNEPKFFPNAGLHQPDGIILDLEDSVAPTEKESARFLVRNALRSVDFYGAERMVRINQIPLGLEDLQFVIPHNVHVILIPKCESAENVTRVEDEINIIKAEKNIENEIFLMPIIESALGVVKSYEIASASHNVCALAVGLEDYTADLGVERTNEGKESLFARCQVINAAKAAGVQAIDTVFSDVDDLDGLQVSVTEAKALGFEGKGCIHPRQIEIINKSFTPNQNEIERSKKIILAFEDAKKKGLGVVSLGSKMIDAPVVKRAQRIIELAIKNELLNKNWMTK